MLSISEAPVSLPDSRSGVEGTAAATVSIDIYSSEDERLRLERESIATAVMA